MVQMVVLVAIGDGDGGGGGVVVAVAVVVVVVVVSRGRDVELLMDGGAALRRRWWWMNEWCGWWLRLCHTYAQLLGREPMHDEAKHDVKNLINIELAVRLLELGGSVDVPSDAPQIPPAPPNFNFVTGD